MLFDWFVVGQVVPHNPAASVRGPKHVVARGKTAVLPREDAKALIDAIETDTLIGLRDRALIGTLLYTFARIEAALGLDVGDYFAAALVHKPGQWLRRGYDRSIGPVPPSSG
jgi:site-specific recombinase XerC